MTSPTSIRTTDNEPGFGVYVHWPFCAQKCPYCDFNSHVRFGGWDEPRFLAAYKRELDHVASLLTNPPPPREGGESPRNKGSTAPVTSIFFGGGTPSLMQPATVAAILDHIAALWPIAPDAEITLEANPGSVEAQRFAGYRAAGINRVSIGVQSLRDADLKRLGRIHSVAEAKAAVDIAHRTFDRVSFDLIYARPGQTPADWRAELDEALGMASGHLSLYQLTIEPGTRFADLYAKGRLVIPPAEDAQDLYELTQELTVAAGLRQYEISNHARPGEESRHNLLYWRYGTYAGIGPGAHGRLATPRAHLATATELSPEHWLARVEEHGHGIAETEVLSPEARSDEMLLMGLRLDEGIDLNRLARIGGFAPRSETVARLIAQGFIERIDTPLEHADTELDEIRVCLGPGLAPSVPATAAPLGRIRATPSGRFLLNRLVLELSASFTSAAPSLHHAAAP
ncbi:radical SAM family heme chaperone HemW [Hyphomicrobium sp.]|uniref:radical SAM family heme chaperone HemW n=1 Tax=Hyphomicrobium sp. TaxID=82 RepID=UPI0025BE7AD5|nr:radical SAM family heme chaperone HemW [Hyphomicrobium sp.]MCC7250412.1 coproporphyrinogen III oxidase [Hyphomicrobium sp.]